MEKILIIGATSMEQLKTDIVAAEKAAEAK